MNELTGRLRRELRTVTAMIELFCRDHHIGEKVPCRKCSDLISYARCRLEKCPYHHDKPTCDQCPIHCYKPERREEIREVMRYSGPRLLRRHPFLAIRHLIDQRRDPPPSP